MEINLLKDGYMEKKKPFWTKRNVFLLSLPLLVTLLISIPVFALKKPQEPISPLQNLDKPEVVRQSLIEEKQSLDYYVATSQTYLNEAKSLAASLGLNQTEDDKKKIISLLNESLKMANNAVKHYAGNPKGYQQRARIYENIAHLDPSAREKAERDINIATKLAGGELEPQDIDPESVLNVSPIQEASLTDTVAIAFPEEGAGESESSQDSNAKKGRVVIGRGQTEVIVSSEFVTNDNLIYFTPQGNTQNEVVSLKNKSEKEKFFTLKLSSPLPHDLPIDWWIVE